MMGGHVSRRPSIATWSIAPGSIFLVACFENISLLMMDYYYLSFAFCFHLRYINFRPGMPAVGSFRKRAFRYTAHVFLSFYEEDNKIVPVPGLGC